MVAWRRAPGDHVRQASRLFDSVLLRRETHIRDRGIQRFRCLQRLRLRCTKRQKGDATSGSSVIAYELQSASLDAACDYSEIDQILPETRPIHVAPCTLMP